MLCSVVEVISNIHHRREFYFFQCLNNFLSTNVLYREPQWYIDAISHIFIWDMISGYVPLDDLSEVTMVLDNEYNWVYGDEP